MDLHQARKDEIKVRLSGIPEDRDNKWYEAAAVALNARLEEYPDLEMPNDPAKYRERLDEIIEDHKVNG
jgi:hypothetical protein